MRKLILMAMAIVLAAPVGVKAVPAVTCSAVALNSRSALISWAQAPVANEVHILRDGRLIDKFATSIISNYTDQLLWPSTTYSYVVHFVLAGPPVDCPANVTTPAQSGSFPRPFAADSFWNKPICNPVCVPVDPNSSAMISYSISGWAQDNDTVFSNDNAWGMPLAFADRLSKSYVVNCPLGCTDPTAKIPRYAKVKTGDDHHLSVWDGDNELDMWIGSYDQGNDSWSAEWAGISSRSGWGAMCGLGQHCNGAVAAGFAAFGGVIRPEEIAQGEIDHALVMVLHTKGSDDTHGGVRDNFIACPATHEDGDDTDSRAIPEGARLQLDPDYPVDEQGWDPWQEVIAYALQKYGAYVADKGDTLELRGEADSINRGYNAWDLADTPLHPDLNWLPWDELRVLEITEC